MLCTINVIVTVLILFSSFFGSQMERSVRAIADAPATTPPTADAQVIVVIAAATGLLVFMRIG